MESKLIQEAHLLKVFPEGKGICKRLLKDIDRQLEILREKEWDIESEQLPYLEAFLVHSYFIDKPRQPLLRNKERLEKILRWASRTDDYLAKKEQIVQIPISDYVKFNSQGFARCLWHEEKTPSMKLNVKRNKVHCFGCEKNGDIIDVVMAQNNVSFKEAFKALSGVV